MNKALRIFYICVFSLAAAFIFSQKKNEQLITGKVYSNMTRSQGILNGGSVYEPQSTFRNQTICFKKDSVWVKVKTDSSGMYMVALTPGTYEVFQEEALKKIKSGMTHFGTDVIEVKKDGGPYDIFFKNGVNGRSARTGVGPGSVNGSGKTKISTQKKSE